MEKESEDKATNVRVVSMFGFPKGESQEKHLLQRNCMKSLLYTNKLTVSLARGMVLV
jgi:hypothetical protein